MNKVSELGKFLRKLRIDNNEYGVDMAKKLNITASYLSAIELGKRNMSEQVKNNLIKKYKLKPKQETELNKYIMDSTKKLKLNTSHLNTVDRDLLYSIYCIIKKLKEEDREEIMEMVKKYL